MKIDWQAVWSTLVTIAEGLFYIVFLLIMVAAILLGLFALFVAAYHGLLI